MAYRFALLACTLAALLPATAQPTADGRPADGRQADIRIPVSFTLPEAGYLTVVVDGPDGTRIRNLVADTYFPSGEHTVYWDGYDEGRARNYKAYQNKSYDIERRRAAPGTYHVKALFHRGIEPVYEFSVYSPGDPPWFVDEERGGWLADHKPPADVHYDAERDEVMVTASVNEAGHGVAFLDRDGAKKRGEKRLSNSYFIAEAVAFDEGPKTDPQARFYLASVKRKRNTAELYLGAERDGRPQKATLNLGRLLDNRPGLDPENMVGGVAVWNRTMAVSIPALDSVFFFRPKGPKSRQLQRVGAQAVESPRGLITDGEGLYVLSDVRLLRYDVDWGNGRLGNPVTIIESGLEDPRRVKRITLPDVQGSEWYVSDWGSAHQVKVFGEDGALRRAIGAPGGPQLGLYDEARMAQPLGFDVTPDGKLWVAEAYQLPKRISRWDAQGDGGDAFDRAWYGPPKYGGGGFLDPADSTRFYYAAWEGTMEFALDWERGTSKPKRILHDRMLRRTSVPQVDVKNLPPERPLYVDGRRYFTSPGASERLSTIDAQLWMLDGDTLRQVANVTSAFKWKSVVSNKRDFPRIHRQVRMADGNLKRVLVAWSDLDFDGRLDEEEVQVAAPGDHVYQTFALGDDLSIFGSGDSYLPPPTFTDDGVPVYDLAQYGRPMASQGYYQGPALVADDWLISAKGPLQGYSLEAGKVAWTYPAQFTRQGPAAPLPSHAGEITSVTRTLRQSVQPSAGEAGEIWGLGGYNGEAYLLTADGYFLTTLLGDQRRFPRWRLPALARGDTLPRVSPGSEHHWPSLNVTPSGDVYLVAGKTHSSLLRLAGLEHVKRLDLGTVEVGQAQLASAAPMQVAWAKEEVKGAQRKTLAVPLAAAGTHATDGDLGEWETAPWVDVSPQLGIRAAIAAGPDSLYLALQTGRGDLLASAGGDARYAFTTGGGIDLLLGRPGADADRDAPAPGDRRLFITKADGKLQATLFEQAADGRTSGPGKTIEADVQYESPIGQVTMGRVADVSALVALGEGSGDYEVAIPLAALGLSPQEGLSVLGDIGVLLGDGTSTQQRVYWSNRANLIVSDLPGEARLTPQHWGVWTFGGASAQ